SCEDQKIERSTLSKNQLVEILNQQINFKDLANKIIQDQLQIEQSLNSLSAFELSRLKSIALKFNGVPDFLLLASVEEKSLIERVVKDRFSVSISIVESIDILSRSYYFDNNDFFEVFNEKLSEHLVKTNASSKTQACNCNDIYLTVYTMVLNQAYFADALPIEEADRQAHIAGSYAHLGCVLACT
ncbi:MAG: hypothetical protein ABL895_17825, partial [Cyclobacteriaceae bacterium]